MAFRVEGPYMDDGKAEEGAYIAPQDKTEHFSAALSLDLHRANISRESGMLLIPHGAGKLTRFRRSRLRGCRLWNHVKQATQHDSHCLSSCQGDIFAVMESLSQIDQDLSTKRKGVRFRSI